MKFTTKPTSNNNKKSNLNILAIIERNRENLNLTLCGTVSSSIAENFF